MATDTFASCVVAIGDEKYDGTTPQQLAQLVREHGGLVVEYVGPGVTHVVSSNTKAPIAKMARKRYRRMAVVGPEWVQGSIDGGAPAAKSQFKPDTGPYVVAADDEEDGGGSSKKTTRGKRGRSTRAKNADEEEEEQDDVADADYVDASSSKKAKGTKEKKKKSADAKQKGRGKSSNNANNSSSVMVKQTVKGRAPVDRFAPPRFQKKCHVLDENNTVWDAMLNQTNIASNNNKFYALQVLEPDNKKKDTSYYLWTRWGRVGASGQHKVFTYSSAKEATDEFCKKFQTKTGCAWNNRANFKARPKKYTMIALDYGVDNDELESRLKKAKTAQGEGEEEEPEIPSKLPQEVQQLVSLIADLQRMKNTLTEMEFDLAQMPLGALKQTTLQKGVKVLKKLEAEIGGRASGSRLAQLSSKYYTLIPHVFGMRTPPVIRTAKQIRAEMELLDALSEIEIGIEVLKKGNSVSKLTENPIDSQYAKLRAQLTPVPLDNSNKAYQVVSSYLKNTHGITYPHNTYKLSIENLFAIERQGERDTFNNAFGKSPNRMLLWHGSRLTNFVGIISQGLRIAPPEAPFTGAMFGKGLYYANCVSKSANYCHATKENPEGLLILSEVALGKCHELTSASNRLTKRTLPKGCHSTLGIGQNKPKADATVHIKFNDAGEMEDAEEDEEGAIAVPLGKLKSDKKLKTDLRYDEYVVYDTAQHTMRYLVHVKFLFK